MEGLRGKKSGRKVSLPKSLARRIKKKMVGSESLLEELNLGIFFFTRI